MRRFGGLYSRVLRSTAPWAGRQMSRIQQRFASAKSTGGQSPLQWYMKMLETNPLPTKVVTSCVIAFGGNMISQLGIEGKSVDKIEWQRTARFMLIIGVGLGGWLHYWYGWLGGAIPGSGAVQVAKRVLVDQFVSAPPILAGVFLAEGALKGELHKVPEQLKAGYLDVMLTNYKVWPAAMAVNFALVPPQFQVLFANAVGLAWNAYLGYMTNASAGGDGSQDGVSAAGGAEEGAPAQSVSPQAQASLDEGKDQKEGRQ